MGARLVHIAGGRRLSVTPLPDGDLLVGRDPSACSLVLESTRVSRQHLLVRATGEGFVAADLGSANGTLLNGAPLLEPTALSPGDVLELAGAARLVFEVAAATDDGTQVIGREDLDALQRAGEDGGEGDGEEELEDADETASPLRALAIVAAVVVLVVGVVVWRVARETDPPFVRDATNVAGDGLAAAERRQWEPCKKKLQSAAGILLSNGYLDDVERGLVLQVAMERLGERLGDRLDRPVDLPNVFWQCVEGARAGIARPQDGADKKLCRLDEVGPEVLRRCLEERVRAVLVSLYQSPDGVPASFYQAVGTRMRVEHDYIERSIRRGTNYVPMMRTELKNAKMPELLHYLALIESGYQPDIGSPAGAWGLWQFMPATARGFGLRVDGTVDERKDPRRSTQMAAKYLRNLTFEFGGDDLLLVLAGYNKGENGVRSALKRMSDPFSDRSYWRLVESNLLPKETADYVPRFMAAAVAGEAGLPSEATLAAAGF